MYRSTLRHLTDLERYCPVHIADQNSFDNSIAERLGPTAQDSDFPAVDLTSKYDLFGDIGDADPDPEHDQANLELKWAITILALT